VDRLLAAMSEGDGLIDCAVSFQDFQPMWSQSTNVTDGQRDGQMDRRHAIARPRSALVHCAVKMHKTVNTGMKIMECKLLSCANMQLTPIQKCFKLYIKSQNTLLNCHFTTVNNASLHLRKFLFISYCDPYSQSGLSSIMPIDKQCITL